MKRIDIKNLQEYILDKGYIVEKFCYKCKKVSYRDECDAKVIAAEMCKRGKGHSYTYLCPKGCGFHLTSMKPGSIKCTRLKRRVSYQKLRHYCY